MNLSMYINIENNLNVTDAKIFENGMSKIIIKETKNEIIKFLFIKDQNINYYNESCKLYLANVLLTSQVT